LSGRSGAGCDLNRLAVALADELDVRRLDAARGGTEGESQQTEHQPPA
jgi:hypothetical protein